MLNLHQNTDSKAQQPRKKPKEEKVKTERGFNWKIQQKMSHLHPVTPSIVKAFPGVQKALK